MDQINYLKLRSDSERTPKVSNYLVGKHHIVFGGKNEGDSRRMEFVAGAEYNAIGLPNVWLEGFSV